jgi:hypothetical protein
MSTAHLWAPRAYPKTSRAGSLHTSRGSYIRVVVKRIIEDIFEHKATMQWKFPGNVYFELCYIAKQR